ncbi:probable serine/threonine-protein kinase PBL18 [Lactuca sativa]|uniref:non-specific serine/threonine protein kinase n=1 Tax=Lactuca sativa TaxID=4236 RepID=A0A9R1VQS3_LACSA|nr:probable serine/threonine-protein kinase PBL18 [Lactuca sativa]KAJ0209553.1 hypothetical protein LSAT_V11C400199500 [Lactuca sativa]
MGNCCRTRRNGDNHYRYVQPHASEVVTAGGAKEPYRSDSKKLTQNLPSPNPRNGDEMILSPHLKVFAFSELINATKYFSPDYLLGEGAFGYVYEGWLNKETLSPVEPESGMPVAIKKLKRLGFQGHMEWLSDVSYLGGLHHRNLVNLIGFCYEGENRLLVSEFMPGGSLEHHLFRRGGEPFSWALRLKVAVEVAQGLAFLHASQSKIIYCDFKSSNVLLDMDYNVKLSVFGLAKADPSGDWSHVTSQITGTEGYTAPEYFAAGRLTTKCDVYSFGIVLLELITGRRAIDYKRVAEEKRLLEWVRTQLRDTKKVFKIMDSRLEGKYSRKAASVVANLALQCCYPEATYRPHMSDVLSILEKIPSPRAFRNKDMSNSKSKINAHSSNGQSNGHDHQHESAADMVHH